jgi:hypothetical protein
LSNDYRIEPVGTLGGGTSCAPKLQRAMSQMRPTTTQERHRAGLCATCAHRREVANTRGSLFYLCERSRSDPQYPRYPRLPVLSCPGYDHERPSPR